MINKIGAAMIRCWKCGATANGAYAADMIYAICKDAIEDDECGLGMAAGWTHARATREHEKRSADNSDKL